MEYKCCNNPEYVRAYIVCWPFKAKYCLNCGEVITDMPKPVEWMFEHFFSYIENKKKREQQVNKCKGCVWAMKQDGVIVCPFVGCIKSK